MPTDFKFREETHVHLSAILNYEGEDRKNFIVELLGGDVDFYSEIEYFLTRALDETDSIYAAILQYFCCIHRVNCTQVPAYLDFMPRIYHKPGDLVGDLNAIHDMQEPKSITEETHGIAILTKQLAEKDKQIESLMEIIQNIKK